jgi:sarcosine oxidase
VTYDGIVVGLGAMGSAAAWQLARRGRRVLGLDAHQRGHTLGSSHGHTRIIRKAYFEDPAYVPLLERAYAMWNDLSRIAGEPLILPTGGLMLGPEEADVVSGAVRSARLHGIPYELLTAAEVRRRFPAFTPDPAMVGVWEPQAGLLNPERCVEAQLAAATQAGADLRHGEPVRSWREEGGHVIVETPRARYEAGLLILTAGPWMPVLLAGANVDLPLTPTRQAVCWFDAASPEQAALLAPDRCPLWICAFERSNIYGTPNVEGRGAKAAIHDTGPACTPETARRDVAPAEVEALRHLLARILPAANGRLIEAGTCLYTMTPDGHFVIGRLHGHPRVTYAAGFSGHGFKFAPVIGEILADLGTEGRTAHPIGFLAPERFSRSQPSVEA